MISKRRSKRKHNGCPGLFVLFGIAVISVGGYIIGSAFYESSHSVYAKTDGKQYSVSFNEEPIEDIEKDVSDNKAAIIQDTEDPRHIRIVTGLLENLLNTGYREVSSDYGNYVAKTGFFMSDTEYTISGHHEPLVYETGHEIVSSAAEISCTVGNLKEKQLSETEWIEYATMDIIFRSGHDFGYFQDLLGLEDIKLNEKYLVTVQAQIIKDGSEQWKVKEIIFGRTPESEQ